MNRYITRTVIRIPTYLKPSDEHVLAEFLVDCDPRTQKKKDREPNQKHHESFHCHSRVRDHDTDYRTIRTAHACLRTMSIYQSSSSCFLAIAFFLASSASARPPATLGVGVVLLLPSDPFAPFRLMPESRCCSAVGFLPAAGRFAGG